MKKRIVIGMMILLAGWSLTGCKGDDDPAEIVLTDIKVEPASLSINVGATAQLEVTPIPADAKAEFDYEPGDVTIAAVSKSGLVTGLKEGETDIIVSSGTIRKTIHVSVSEIYMTDIDIDTSPLLLMVYDAVQLEPKGVPENAIDNGAIDQTFSFRSNDPDVVTVDAYGKVLALGRGEAKITIKHGDITKEINVTVEDFSDKADWTVTTDNLWGEEGDPNMWWAAAANILNTWDEIFWHSDPGKPLPATITVDMKHTKRIASFDYGCPKAGSGNDAVPLEMTVEVSPDGTAWTKVVDLEECPSGRGVLHQFPMETPVWARYYRATVSAVWGGYPFLQLSYLAPSDIEAPEAD
ncbi:MAG: Ig-like domain-containing protein [Tannerella sp.]|jgi:hypothetical protein|nr:Ig-like domain-containing protein [Tannerella sp.]